MKVLMAFIEPTPYIVDLISVIQQQAQDVDVLFLKINASQNWNIPLSQSWQIFPNKFSNRIAWLMQLLMRQSYDLVHIAGWSEPWYVLLLLIAKLKGARILIESDTPMPHYTKRWKRAIKRLVYPNLFKLVNLFLPGGKRQAKYIEYYGVPAKRIIPVQMTIDIARIQAAIKHLTPADRNALRVQYQIQASDKVFLYVGRLVDSKGIVDLITAFNQLSQPDVKLLIVGDGELKPYVLESLAANDKIRFAGRVQSPDLVPLYYLADALVLPSRHEPWGLVVNEAMAAGLPVIVSDRVGCIDDLVTHQETGLIVKAECPTELKQAMEFMAQSEFERNRMRDLTLARIQGWTIENEASNICQAWHLVTQK